MGCISNKSHRRDIQVDLRIRDSIYEVGAFIEGEVIYTIYNAD